MTVINKTISLQERTDAFLKLGKAIEAKLSDYETALKPVIMRSYADNQWFTERFVLTALRNWVTALKDVQKWMQPYSSILEKERRMMKVGVVNAGNIPFVGLHDLISVLISGHSYLGKNATGDTILLPFITSLLIEIEPAFGNRIEFVDRLKEMDAVIATGSNNSARYFEYYFSKYPHIIRMNRNGVGVLTGNEPADELKALGDDIFTYFGLGCRNVSKLYVPEGYDFKNFFEAIADRTYMAESSKYMNNFEYNNSILLLKRIPFLQNGFMILREEKHIASSISVLHYEKYSSKAALANELIKDFDKLQCIAAPGGFFNEYEKLNAISVKFGGTQSPSLWDYADGVDTIKFLGELN